HLLIEVPVFLSTGKIPTTVEIQIRTVAMDFWASLEHKIRYKKDITDKDIANDRLKACADIIFDLDVEMQSINTY
ncbi:MAG: GTP pyrophosphokinase family protein, partial [Clostridia bacterium]